MRKKTLKAEIATLMSMVEEATSDLSLVSAVSIIPNGT